MGHFDSLKSNNPFRHSAHSSSNYDNNDKNDNVDDVAPPAGPPPKYSSFDPRGDSDDYAPPPGPPPGPPPSHPWQSVPLPEDTSSYPPPPDIFTGHDRSWAHNATEQQAEEGERWCRRYALLAPRPLTDPSLTHAPYLVPPQSNTFHGTITQTGPATWAIATTAARNNDHCITAQPPLYVAARDDPRKGQSPPRTIYFEVVLPRDLGRDAGVGIGFTALPYPGFRMPGWHRGSLAVHSDDGHRYVNDRWGGIDFVRPWGKKGVVGIGMKFSAAAAALGDQGLEKGKGKANGVEVEVFFTRNGKVEARWDINEERDQKRDLAPVGVQGYHDLVGAVGSFDKAEYEIVLDPSRWVYKGV